MKATIVLLGVILSLLCSVVLSEPVIELDHGIMIDSGSTGSRIYLYEWPKRNDTTLPLVLATYCINQYVVSFKNEKPLASYAENPENVGESLTDLVSYVKKELRENYWHSTPIYLMATAGMRAIPLEDQQAIMIEVRKYLHHTSFYFRDEFANVISGTDEGLYGWLAVNYLNKALVQNNQSNLVGALDMGGASTQITFQTHVLEKSNPYNMTASLSSGVSYPVYAYSYPLGQNQAESNVLNGLASDANSTEGVESPCWLVGQNDKFNGTSFVGTGDFEKCKAAVLKYVVQPDENCTSCGMQSVYQPSINGTKFFAFSAYAYAYSFFGLESNSTINELSEATKKYCSMSFDEVKQTYKTVSPKYLKQYCYSGIYFSEVLKQYGFDPTSTDQLFVSTDVLVNSVSRIEVTWALGAMIKVADLLPVGSIIAPSDDDHIDKKPETDDHAKYTGIGVAAGAGGTSVLFALTYYGKKRYDAYKNSADYSQVELQSSTV